MIAKNNALVKRLETEFSGQLVVRIAAVARQLKISRQTMKRAGWRKELKLFRTDPTSDRGPLLVRLDELARWITALEGSTRM